MAEAFHAANNYLVFRLQLHGDSHDGLPIFYEAADEIKRLQEERKKIIADRDEARRELCAARRELCRNEAIIRLQRHRVHRDSEDVVGLAKEIAVERGWDCFKENTND